MTEKSNDHIWYACYGSNINYERFMRYISSCSDSTPPAESRAFRMPYDIYFAASSVRWENRAVAFLDDTELGAALGRIYRITRAQYEEVKLQEGPKYTKMVALGSVDGLPVYTFTDVKRRSDTGEPSEAYFDTILRGLIETYPEKSRDELMEYLKAAVAQNSRSV